MNQVSNFDKNGTKKELQDKVIKKELDRGAIKFLNEPDGRNGGQIVRPRNIAENGSRDEIAYQEMLASEIENMVNEKNIY